MTPIAMAQAAKREKHLDKQVRTDDYGIVTWREYVTRRIKDGGFVAVGEYYDHALRSKLEAEYESLNRGFNVPWGNAKHPTTIKAQALKDRLAGHIYSAEYRLHSSIERYSVISKTAYDFGASIGGSKA